MSANLFNTIKLKRPKRNRFDLSHDVKASCNMGQLVPTMFLECVPGDSFNLGCDQLLRFAPMVSPVMHRIDVYHHYWFVPYRILWKNWETYITGSKDGKVVTPPAFPTGLVGTGAGLYTKLHDYLGMPNITTVSGGYLETVSALPCAAYQRIWYDFYRDQNMQQGVTRDDIDLVDGDQGANWATISALRNRCWEHDYFTACLPFTQKGPEVTLPLAGFGDVPVKVQPTADWGANADWPATAGGGTGTHITVPAGDPSWTDVGDQSELYAETSTLSPEPTTVNELRFMYRLQTFLEKAARGGTRYAEHIWSMFGVKSDDARLQRPEYITGVKSPVIVSEVLQTSESGGTPQGNMAGHAVALTQGHYGKYYCKEHGCIIGIMSVMPKTAYYQGVPKFFTKVASATNDYFWPDFAHLGEQAVLNREVYAGGVSPFDTFGYVPRYSEYKFMPNRVAGDFRTSLDYWHMARNFAAPPALNEDFVVADPTTRIFADTNPGDDHIWFQVLHKVLANRGMPKFGTPGW